MVNTVYYLLHLIDTIVNNCLRSNLGLIRWRIVIHGFIDGYSRLITGLRASDNNMGDTVLDIFLSAAEVYGVPSRLRGDHGTENIVVATWMEEHRGARRGSYIWGRSVCITSATIITSDFSSLCIQECAQCAD